MLSTLLINDINLIIAVPPPIWNDQKIFHLAEWLQLIRASAIKPHVYKGCDL